MFVFLFLGMDVINEALEAAVRGKDKKDWTPVSVNVAPATLTILSKQVRDNRLNVAWTHGERQCDLSVYLCITCFHSILTTCILNYN